MSKATKKFKCDKYLPATKHQKYFAIVEGDCLDKNTEIFNLSENSIVKINDINIGDLVLTHNQNIKPIVNKSYKLINCYKIKTKSGNEIICSKEHRFFVYDSISNSFKWKKLANINKNTDKLIKNKLSNNLFFDKICIDPINNKKYKLRIYGDTYAYDSSYEHKYLVFNIITSSFELLKAKDIDTNNYLMVICPNI
jgi:intein/homing endonuclease